MFYFTLNCAQRKRARSATWHGQINDETMAWGECHSCTCICMHDHEAYAPLESMYWIVNNLWQLWVSHRTRIDPPCTYVCIYASANAYELRLLNSLFSPADFSTPPRLRNTTAVPAVPVTQLSCRTLMKRRCVWHSYKQMATGYPLHTPPTQTALKCQMFRPQNCILACHALLPPTNIENKREILVYTE